MDHCIAGLHKLCSMDNLGGLRILADSRVERQAFLANNCKSLDRDALDILRWVHTGWVRKGLLVWLAPRPLLIGKRTFNFQSLKILSILSYALVGIARKDRQYSR